MSTQLPLRDYQTAALDAVWDDWYQDTQRVAVVAPTGAGKTVMFAHLIRNHLHHNARATTHAEMRFMERAVVLVHRDELADQAIAKIRAVAPDLRVGKVKAGDNEVRADVVVASVPTLARGERLDQLKYGGKPIGLVVVDECHHAVAPSWKSVLTGLGAFGGTWDNDFGHTSTVDVVGFSATLARGDGIGLGSVWQKISYAISLTRLMRRGYLTDVRGLAVKVEDLDLAGVRRSGGDFQSGALGDAMVESETAEVLTAAYQEHAPSRPGIVFMPNVASAEQAADVLTGAGIPSALVTGTTSTEDRRLIFKRYASGDIQVLVNCMVLTEGFDAPWAEVVVPRPTQSAPLYTQMVGRVLRPWQGKKDALVLDVMGATGRHKLATLIDLAPGQVVTVRPDQTLAEAVEEAELAAIADEKERERYALASKITARQVDLFAASKNVWLRTKAGVWFIPTRSGEVFLWPSSEPGTFDVCHAPEVREPSGRRRSLPWERKHVGLSLELAMSWAQTEAEELDPSVASRDSSWRKSGGRISEAQKGMVVRFPELVAGRDIDTLKKSDASDIISIGLSSKKFDKHYERVN